MTRRALSIVAFAGLTFAPIATLEAVEVPPPGATIELGGATSECSPVDTPECKSFDDVALPFLRVFSDAVEARLASLGRCVTLPSKPGLVQFGITAKTDGDGRAVVISTEITLDFQKVAGPDPTACVAEVFERIKLAPWSPVAARGKYDFAFHRPGEKRPSRWTKGK
jgi:hypothetical protein